MIGTTIMLVSASFTYFEIECELGYEVERRKTYPSLCADNVHIPAIFEYIK